VPALAARVDEEFRDVLSTRTGRLCKLMLCANVARAYKRSGTKLPLTDTMGVASARLLAELR
jgi:hypothetical protein